MHLEAQFRGSSVQGLSLLMKIKVCMRNSLHNNFLLTRNNKTSQKKNFFRQIANLMRELHITFDLK